ncbi:MAG: hypothetical protein M3310_01245 [Actinomycetota bacterium]|nr:hypothetical protein [Actinomycetota bacterium]
MPFWRSEDDEPAHERLAREGGIDLGGARPSRAEPFPPGERIPFVGAIREPGIHGLHRQRQWDVVATAEAPDVPGEEAEFVALPDGTLLLDDAIPDGAVTPLAEAVEQVLAPPYRATAVRRDGPLWGVAANRIDVVEVPEDVAGETVTLAVRGAERTLLVDDRPAWNGVPTLEAHAAAGDSDYVLRAERLDGNLWAVTVSPL